MSFLLHEVVARFITLENRKCVENPESGSELYITIPNIELSTLEKLFSFRLSRGLLKSLKENNHPQVDKDLLHFRFSRVINRATTYCLPLHYIQISPNGKRKIRDPYKDKIDSSRTIAMIQRGPWSWTNSIIFITIGESRVIKLLFYISDRCVLLFSVDWQARIISTWYYQIRQHRTWN
jgi:hypothetical protein